MRRHGWQLPYHPLQIVAIAVFFALVFAFYVFFVPFVGSKVLEIAVIVLYSPTVVVVFALYIWCVAVNPADDGLLHFRKCNSPSCTKSRGASSVVSCKVDRKDLEINSAPGTDRCLTLEVEKSVERDQLSSCWACALCTKKPKFTSNEGEMLYCSLCKVEISMDSKHCRVCDKCIDGFDHHCRWLNNCVGRKNYKDFVALMVSGIAMLILQWSVGLWVLIHCFLRFTYFQGIISSKLGSSFSSVAYIVVVAVCTLLAMASTYPLAQLFFFHILLIKKGISTYDYIVAMREQDQKGVGDPIQSSAASPISSVGTANSGGSSVGALQGRGWCTPPRFFLDHEQGVYPPERSFARSVLPSKPEYHGKKPVKLNPWALAALNKDDVLRAATTAKKQSSILQPVISSNERAVVHDSSGSGNSTEDPSIEFTPVGMRSAGGRGAELQKPNLASQYTPRSFVECENFSITQIEGSGSDSGDVIQLSRRVQKALNPLQMEAMNAFKSSHAFSTNGTTISSPGSSRASSEPQYSPPGQLGAFEIPHTSVLPADWRYNVRESMGESDGDASYPCTPIRQVVYAAGKGNL